MCNHLLTAIFSLYKSSFDKLNKFHEKIPHSEKSQKQTFRIFKSWLFFTLLFAGIVTVNAQQKKYPLSTNLKGFQPRISSQVPPVNNTSVAKLTPNSGTWAPVTQLAPHYNYGGMLLLSDGSVLAKSNGGGGEGKIYDRLTPDASGSYANGTWSSIAAMHDDRLFYSSQVLKDGRVYVAGGEYGNGFQHGEVYDPLANTWTSTPNAPVGISDANSEILENGHVLQALVYGTGKQTLNYDPSLNTYTPGPSTLDYFDESAWLKLPDNSILYVDVTFDGDDHSTERYIPSLNQWVPDAPIPVSLYDPYGYEAGGAVMLPDGRAFFIGSLSNTAFYTPSGNATPGTWTAGPPIPNSLGAVDAAAAMMANGKVLCAFSPAPTSKNTLFIPPTYFYEFDYTTNTFTQVLAPGNVASLSNISSFQTNMLDLPDGTVMYAQNQDATSRQYYIYTPSGAPTASGKPVIGSIRQNSCTNYTLFGTQFNGISEGATYGDDWQMATNYPVVRLTSGTNVYYCRTHDWNSTGIMRGNAPDSVTLDLPTGLPDGTYSLVVTANGIASDPISIVTGVKTYYYDGDGDGYYGSTQQSCINPGAGYSLTTLGQDCNDADASVHSSITYYKDNDGDGFGDINNTTSACSATPPDGYVSDSSDCDDTKVLYADNDGDGYGAGSPAACGVDNNTDCNDADVNVNAPVTYYKDNDTDGFGDINNTTSACSAAPPAGYVANSTDCNDADNTIYPGAPELCDGKDNNCDGTVDEGCAVTKIRINNAALNEGNKGQKSMKFNVTLSIASAGTVTVDYKTVNNTATAPSDYLAQTGTLTFNPGVKKQTIAITIKGDKVRENDETFKVILSNAVNAAIGDNTGIGTILNDDQREQLTFTAMNDRSSSNSSTHSVLVSPNPATSIINVRLSGYTGHVKMQLMDLQGKVLKENELQADNVKYAQQQFNIANIASGTYLLVVMDEQGNKDTKKVIIVR